MGFSLERDVRDRPSIVHTLKTYIQSPTVCGIITAMSNSSVDEISYEERIKNGIKIKSFST